MRRALFLVFAVGCFHDTAPPAAPPPPPAPQHERAAKATHHDDGALAVTSIEPDKGDADGGTYVRINGSNFIAQGARNAKVYFGNRQGTVVRFASDTELIVEAPGGKAGDQVDVLVIFEPGGELKIPNGFTFVAKP